MSKRLISERGAVAGALLMPLVGLFMSSCLLPQNDDPLPDPPTIADHAPVIRTVFPAMQVGTIIGVTDMATHQACQNNFEVFADDEDPGDTQLHAIWRASSPDFKMKTDWSRSDEPLIPDPTAPFIPPQTFFNNAPLNVAGPVRIEVVVSDRHFTTSLVNQTETLGEDPYAILMRSDGGPVVEPAGTASYVWDVIVQQNCP